MLHYSVQTLSGIVERLDNRIPTSWAYIFISFFLQSNRIVLKNYLVLIYYILVEFKEWFGEV